MNGMKKDTRANLPVENGEKSDLSGITNSEQSKKSNAGPTDPLLNLAQIIKTMTQNQVAHTELLDIVVKHMIDLEKRVQILEGRAPKEPPKGYQ